MTYSPTFACVFHTARREQRVVIMRRYEFNLKKNQSYHEIMSKISMKYPSCWIEEYTAYTTQIYVPIHLST